MRLSELIQQLQEDFEEIGDVEVYITSLFDGCHSKIKFRYDLENETLTLEGVNEN